MHNVEVKRIPEGASALSEAQAKMLELRSRKNRYNRYETFGQVVEELSRVRAGDNVEVQVYLADAKQTSEIFKKAGHQVTVFEESRLGLTCVIAISGPTREVRDRLQRKKSSIQKAGGRPLTVEYV